MCGRDRVRDHSGEHPYVCTLAQGIHRGARQHACAVLTTLRTAVGCECTSHKRSRGTGHTQPRWHSNPLGSAYLTGAACAGSERSMLVTVLDYRPR